MISLVLSTENPCTREIKYEWTNDTVSICLPAWVRLDFDITTVQVLCGVPASNWQLYTCIYSVVPYCELRSINKCTTISHNLNTWDLSVVKVLCEVPASNWQLYIYGQYDAVSCTAATNAQGNMQLTPGR